MERTYIMIKPDGVQRNLVGEIIARFEKKGYKLAALKVLSYRHYCSASDKVDKVPLVNKCNSCFVFLLVDHGLAPQISPTIRAPTIDCLQVVCIQPPSRPGVNRCRAVGRMRPCSSHRPAKLSLYSHYSSSK